MRMGASWRGERKHLSNCHTHTTLCAASRSHWRHRRRRQNAGATVAVDRSHVAVATVVVGAAGSLASAIVTVFICGGSHFWLSLLASSFYCPKGDKTFPSFFYSQLRSALCRGPCLINPLPDHNMDFLFPLSLALSLFSFRISPLRDPSVE